MSVYVLRHLALSSTQRLQACIVLPSYIVQWRMTEMRTWLQSCWFGVAVVHNGRDVPPGDAAAHLQGCRGVRARANAQQSQLPTGCTASYLSLYRHIISHTHTRHGPRNSCALDRLQHNWSKSSRSQPRGEAPD